MTTGIILSWVGLITLMLFTMFVLTEVSWRVFLWLFWVVDTQLQDRHWQKLQKNWASSKDIQKIYHEGQEMAA